MQDENTASFKESDPNLDEIWADEALARLAAYRAGNLGWVDAEEIFGDDEPSGQEKH